MKNLIIGFLLGLFITACASSIPLLVEQERPYHPCEGEDGPIGTFCFSQCVKTHWLTGKCTEWQTERKDMCSIEGHKSLIDGGWRLVTESQIKKWIFR